MDGSLENLTNLFLYGVTNPAILGRVIPSTLESLVIEDIAIYDWDSLNEVLIKQQHLQELKLKSMSFGSFNFSPLNASIVSLELHRNAFERDSLQSCICFMKTLSNLKEVNLNLSYGVDSEVIRHILGHNPLQIFHLSFDKIWTDTLGDLRTINASVETLILDGFVDELNCHDIVRCFPSTNALVLNVNNLFSLQDVNLEPIQALNLRALQLKYVTNSMLDQMNFSLMREVQFHRYDPDPYAISEVWENFFARNPGLEILRLSRNTTFDMMILAFENLAQLKRLVIRSRVIIREEQQNDLIKLLENNLNRLEMFSIHFCFRNNQEMLDFSRSLFPIVSQPSKMMKSLDSRP